MLWQVKIINVSCARHTVQSSEGKAVWIYKSETILLKIRIHRTYFLNSSKKWAIFNGKGAE